METIESLEDAADERGATVHDSASRELAPSSGAGGYMAIIEKLATAPTKESVEVMKSMMEMQERWEDRNARKEFDACRARISAKLSHIRVVKKRVVGYDIDKNDKAKGQKEAFKYASMEDIDRLVRPVLDEERMVVSYDMEPCAIAGWHTIVCWLSHAGHREPYRMPMPLDTSGGKGNAQAMGSTQSYGMRRTLCGALNIITIGEDDDGAGGAITDEQAVQIKSGLQEVGLDVVRFLKSMRVPEGEGVESIRTREYVRALAAIENKRYQNKKDKK